MARILKKKTTKKINVKLQQLRESEFHTTLGEDYVHDSSNLQDSLFYRETSVEKLKEKGTITSKLSVAIDFVKNQDKLKTRYLFYSNKFTASYNGISIGKDECIILHRKGTLDFYPAQDIETVTLSVTKDAVFYNINRYKLCFKKHLYLAKSKPKGFLFDFNTGKLKLYPGSSLSEIVSENKKAFRLMLDKLGLEFITDEILALDWINRIGLEKAIKYSITTGKQVIQEKLRYSSLEYTEHTSSLLYKVLHYFNNLTPNETTIIYSSIYELGFKLPNKSYHNFVTNFSECTNIDAYLSCVCQYYSGLENAIIKWKNKNTFSLDSFDSEYLARASFSTFYRAEYSEKEKLYPSLYLLKHIDFGDTVSQCKKLGVKINLAWSEKRLQSFHDELTWRIMKIEAEVIEDENYYNQDDSNSMSDDAIYFDGLELITTKKRLYTEGAIQQHCVFTNYEQRVKFKKYIVFSMLNKENKRITIGCDVDRVNGKEESNYEAYKININQSRLKRNDTVGSRDSLYIKNIIDDNNFQYRVLSYIGVYNKSKETSLEKEEDIIVNEVRNTMFNTRIEENIANQIPF